ncbi:hypothetical protein OPQ81_007419 [Rhizoctonia solani]|nr:hypothetical protein OPQ81_007419 [Rhizoctonia solani]
MHGGVNLENLRVPRHNESVVRLAMIGGSPNSHGKDHFLRFQGQGELDDLEKAVDYLSIAISLTPGGHENLPFLLSNLGAYYGTRFKHRGELEDLEKSIECQYQAITLTPDGHPDLTYRLGNLGGFHVMRFQQLGDLGDLEKAIECESAALTLTPDDDSNMPPHLMNLGVFYRLRSQRLGERGDLEKAIECTSRAVALTPDGHPDLAIRLLNLGATYSHRSQRMGELEDLDKAIECLSGALVLTPDGHPDLPSRLVNLGVSYSHRFERLGDLDDLEKAIECKFRAVMLTRDGHPDLPARLMNLAVSHRNRFVRLGELEDLEKAIECQSGSLKLTPDGHPHLPSHLMNLGVSYSHRFERLGGLDDLEKAIECESCALTLTPSDHPDLPTWVMNLGKSYFHRFERLGELADLEKAIECDSRAIKLIPNDHPNLPLMLMNLGGSFTHRFKCLGELADLEKAIECQSGALAMTPDGHPNLPSILINLGLSYRDRSQRLAGKDDLEKAIECQSRALTLTPDGHPHLPSHIMNLGASYSYRFVFMDEPADLEKAIECESRALVLTPDGHPDVPYRLLNLAVFYTDRFRLLWRLEDIQNATTYALCALDLTPSGHPNLPQMYRALAISQLLHSQCTSDHSLFQDSMDSFRKASQAEVGAPKFKYLAALEWAKISSLYSSPDCIEAYKTAIGLLPQFIWLGATTYQRYQDLDNAKNLAGSAASAAIRFSQNGLALEWLEHARCVVWNQSLMLRSPLDELHSSHQSLAARLQTVAHQLHQVGSESRAFRELPSNAITPEQAAQQHHRLAEEYNDLLTKARELPGFEGFLQPMKANGLVHAARNGPVVVINCSEDRCDALVILPGQDNIKLMPLPDFNHEKAQKARSELEKSLRRKGIRERGVKVLEQPGHEDSIVNVLFTLWEDVVKPVLEFLGYVVCLARGYSEASLIIRLKDNVSENTLPHITWCPTGALSFLPLHAAGNYDQPQSKVFDYVISSYTPTLNALLTSTPSSLSPTSRVLAISQENTPGLSSLPGTALELASVKAHTQGKAEYSQLIDDQATTAAVLDAMEQHDWIHLACHAHQNVEDPTKSGFYLHDGTLDLASINRRSFKNKGLAFLSACQTAKGDEKLPDEAIHLASGMLMAGYPSVIATLWSVRDKDAPLVAEKVYGQLMHDGKVGKGEAGKALHYAVAALRGEVGEMEFARWVPFIHIGS